MTARTATSEEAQRIYQASTAWVRQYLSSSATYSEKTYDKDHQRFVATAMGFKIELSVFNGNRVSFEVDQK